MAKSISIKVKTQVKGIHNWADCPIKSVDFLKNPHRHLFIIRVKIPVTHADRNLEFFVVQRMIEDILRYKYPETRGVFDFGSSSCEMIADYILEEIRKVHRDLSWLLVSVSEDDENEGSVMWTRETSLL